MGNVVRTAATGPAGRSGTGRVLTHVRRSFGNDAPPVEPGQVAAIRAAGKP